MKRYEIKITFANGDEVKMRVQGRNKSDAMHKTKADARFKEFADGNGGIISEEVTPIPIASIDNTRFCVTTIDNKLGWYVVADLENRIKVEFKKGYYKERQHVYNLDGNDIAGVDLSSILHDIDKFMFNNFKELV